MIYTRVHIANYNVFIERFSSVHKYSFATGVVVVAATVRIFILYGMNVRTVSITTLNRQNQDIFGIDTCQTTAAKTSNG